MVELASPGKSTIEDYPKIPNKIIKWIDDFQRIPKIYKKK